jgi:hypothetical protein
MVRGAAPRPGLGERDGEVRSVVVLPETAGEPRPDTLLCRDRKHTWREIAAERTNDETVVVERPHAEKFQRAVPSLG